MGYYPIFMELGGKACLVVGGGVVAERKVLGLLKAKAKVVVLSPRLTEGLTKLKRGRRIRHIAKPFAAYIKDNNDYLRAFTLVITATSSKKTNELVFEMTSEAKIPINTVDDPALCTFIVPAIVERGAMQIAISTSGKSPTLARNIKELLNDALPRELAIYTEIMGAVRAKLMAADREGKALKVRNPSGVRRPSGVLKKKAGSAKRYRLYEEILASPMLAWIRTGEGKEIDKVLKKLLGAGYTLKALGIKITKR